mmetsp:Transcript_96688/g.243734  ORF Transcript_96688/g.243734 Transcript_96688/m.243734 type:complete len:283 (-) Transcript_96688:830-1678(-)
MLQHHLQAPSWTTGAVPTDLCDECCGTTTRHCVGTAHRPAAWSSLPSPSRGLGAAGTTRHYLASPVWRGAASCKAPGGAPWLPGAAAGAAAAAGRAAHGIAAAGHSRPGDASGPTTWNIGTATRRCVLRACRSPARHHCSATWRAWCPPLPAAWTLHAPCLDRAARRRQRWPPAPGVASTIGCTWRAGVHSSARPRPTAAPRARAGCRARPRGAPTAALALAAGPATDADRADRGCIGGCARADVGADILEAGPPDAGFGAEHRCGGAPHSALGPQLSASVV